MDELIKQAIEKYDAHEAVREAEQEARQQADQKAAEQERAALREFLATLMPAELVQYAKLDNYRLAHAREFRTGDSNGTVVTVRPPECFPIELRVYADRHGNFEHEKEKWARYDDGPYFFVRSKPEIVQDEFGDEGFFIDFRGAEPFEDFMTALGYAAVRGPDLYGLQEELEQLKEADALEEARPDLAAEPEELTRMERMVIALENIADGIAALHLYNS